MGQQAKGTSRPVTGVRVDARTAADKDPAVRRDVGEVPQSGQKCLSSW